MVTRCLLKELSAKKPILAKTTYADQCNGDIFIGEYVREYVNNYNREQYHAYFLISVQAAS